MGTTEQTTVEERLDRVESRSAIERLMADYAFGCDRKDRERFMGVFHEDAEYFIPGDFGTSTGSAQIEETLRAIWAGMPETRHLITNVTVDFTGPDSAKGDAHVICYSRMANGREGFVYAYYDNRYERRDGVWRASSISLEVPWWKLVEFGDMLAD